MSRVLITGAAGLLGSRMVEWILKNTDSTVYGVDDLSGGFLSNLKFAMDTYPNRFRFAKLDVLNDKLNDIFSQFEPHYVFHFAAYAAECVSPFIRKFNYSNNLVATSNIVNNCIKYGVKRLVFTSSMAVYGDAEAPFEESLIPAPIDPYGVAKYACEMDIQIAGSQHGLDWCIIRPHNVYGRNQNLWDSYRNFIGICMYKAMIGDPITIFGDGSQTRAFSEMTDSCEPFWRAAVEPRASKQIINLGGTEEISILEVGKIVQELSGATIKYLPPRLEVKHAWSTWDKSVDILGFVHRTDIYSGIESMWSWAQTQPKRERFIWNEYEIENGLYPQWKQDALTDGFYKTN